MTDTIDDVAAKAEGRSRSSRLSMSRVWPSSCGPGSEKGIELVGPNGLPKQLTKRVLETARDLWLLGSSTTLAAACC